MSRRGPQAPDLRETLEAIDHMRRTERRVAMATLVSTEGTTPKSEGAKMWVGEGGRILGSVTIGGCVDTQVVAESDDVLTSRRPKLLALSLRDEEGWDMGLTCGGNLRVLIEPVALDARTDPVTAAYEVIRQEAARGRCAIAVAPLDGGPRRLVVREDGPSEGTLGDPALDGAAGTAALEVLRAGASRTMQVAAPQGPAECFFEFHGPPTRLLIFGATHVAMPLVAFATVLGWRTTVIDARERFATRERFPNADELLIGNVGEIAERQHYDAATYVVIVTHDYKFELPILRAVLAHEPAYIGLLASRTRARALREFLAADGIDTTAIDRVHIPIGLRIGAQSAAEIALSVMAQVVAVRSERLAGARPSAAPAG